MAGGGSKWGSDFVGTAPVSGETKTKATTVITDELYKIKQASKTAQIWITMIDGLALNRQIRPYPTWNTAGVKDLAKNTPSQIAEAFFDSKLVQTLNNITHAEYLTSLDAVIQNLVYIYKEKQRVLTLTIANILRSDNDVRSSIFQLLHHHIQRAKSLTMTNKNKDAGVAEETTLKLKLLKMSYNSKEDFFQM